VKFNILQQNPLGPPPQIYCRTPGRALMLKSLRSRQMHHPSMRATPTG